MKTLPFGFRRRTEASGSSVWAELTFRLAVIQRCVGRTRKRLKRLRKQAARKAQLEKLQKRAQTMFMFRLTFRRLIVRERGW